MDQYNKERLRQAKPAAFSSTGGRWCKSKTCASTKLLPKEQVEAALVRHEVRSANGCIPAGDALDVPVPGARWDHSCRAAVASLLALLCVGGKDAGSARTDPYCKARQRLPESFWPLARRSGSELQQQVASPLLGGRPIVIADGTTLSMPDTPANQTAYPQPAAHQPGVGFPILRLVGLIGLSCGAVLDVALAPWHGKQTGEMALLRQLLDSLQTRACCWPMPSSVATGWSPCCQGTSARICWAATTANGRRISVGRAAGPQRPRGTLARGRDGPRG